MIVPNPASTRSLMIREAINGLITESNLQSVFRDKSKPIKKVTVRRSTEGGRHLYVVSVDFVSYKVVKQRKFVSISKKDFRSKVLTTKQTKDNTFKFKSVPNYNDKKGKWVYEKPFIKGNALQLYRQKVSFPQVIYRKESVVVPLCGESTSSTPDLLPVREELNSLIFLQDTVLKLHQFITNNSLGKFESNVNISSIEVDPLRKSKTKKSSFIFPTQPDHKYPWQMPNPTYKRNFRLSLEKVSRNTKVFPSRQVCRRVGCGIAASIQTNQVIRDKLVKGWVSDLAKVSGFQRLFDLKSKHLSVNSRQESKHRNSNFKHTVVIFLPYKSQQFNPVPPK